MSLTLKDAKRGASAQFAAAGLPTPDLDARILLGHAAGLTPAQMIAQSRDALSPKARERFQSFTARRLAHEPVDHILGTREFYGRPFKISKDVLSPRPETEMLIDEALVLLKDNPAARILDLGTGSGAIVITLLAELERASGTAVDVSSAALGIAKENAQQLGVASRMDWIKGSWFDGAEGVFDLIMSNPPYITDTAMAQLDPEVSGFDPDVALRGGPDGLNPYRDIISKMKPFMAKGSAALFEIGFDQKDSVLEILEANGFKGGICKADICGHDRMIKVYKPQ